MRSARIAICPQEHGPQTSMQPATHATLSVRLLTSSIRTQTPLLTAALTPRRGDTPIAPGGPTPTSVFRSTRGAGGTPSEVQLACHRLGSDHK